jgi:DNA-binding response OmpR family regulator
VQQLAAEAQADLFMEKPFDLDELVAVVKRVIG